jgi:hypothetical protein
MIIDTSIGCWFIDFMGQEFAFQASATAWLRHSPLSFPRFQVRANLNPTQTLMRRGVFSGLTAA